MSNTASDNQGNSTDGRDHKGRFTAGNGGRPVGAKGKLTRERLADVKALWPEALQSLREAIHRGEWKATLHVLNACLPAGRTIDLEGADSPQDIAAALAAGDLSPAEAKDITAALANIASITELADLRERLEEIEAIIAERKG